MDPAAYEAEGIVEITIESSVDGSREPSLAWRAPGDAPRPVLVSLHTWSADQHNQVESYLPFCRRNGWHLLKPEFRGPNLTTNPRATEACASPLALQDVLDAVEHLAGLWPVEREAVLLAGGSGGGHMAMMLAGYRPAFWRGVAAFCGITDLEQWHADNPNYSGHIEACCGGAPSEATRAEYRRRSPLYHAESLARAELCIYHGKFDSSVPVEHGLRIYEAVQRIDPRSRVFLEVFDGGHEMPLERMERQFLALLDGSSEGVRATR